MRSALLIYLLLSATLIFAQNAITLTGRVVNEKGEGIEDVNVKVLGSDFSTTTASSGRYTLKILATGKDLKISYTLTGYVPQVFNLKLGSQIQVYKEIVLVSDVTELKTVTVNSGSQPGNLQTIDNGLIQNIPSVSGNFESVLKTLPGVSANNELSSQYSVRGGNFDENLLYINDVEIFRPLLVRNGQQEGLSFINPELVSKASFSAGGFEARYGEKLSSVLDVRYGKPDSSQIIASAGMLGLSASAKLPYKNAYLLAGFRKKTNQSILKSQPVKGSYQPQFYDFQLLYNVDINSKFNISAFADYNLSRFTLIPESRETIFGTIDQQYRLRINYQGQEKDQYQSLASAITFSYKASQNLWFKWLNSAFNNLEQETFDIEGRYIFDEVSSGNGEFENARVNRGIGVSYEYARNRLRSSIYSSEVRGYLQRGRSFFESGIRYQYDRIKDHLNEYQFIDSAGYILPNNTENLILTDVVNAENTVQTNRITAYIQNTTSLAPFLTISAGIRSNYNTYTNELLLSPRFSAIYTPGDKNIVYRLSIGSYNQPPFYRELRNFDGSLNPGARAQRSIHLLGAADHSFKRNGNLVKFTSEAYFKKLYNLVPYKIENLRVRYFADQQAEGYAMGADFALSREFVSGLESSFRLSFMKTAEDIEGDSYESKDQNGNSTTVYPGYLKRPTDQRVNFSAFFQDKLFNSPSYKVHLTLLYGSALPAGPPASERYRDHFKIPSYKRVDIGFSKDLLEGDTKNKIKPFTRYFDSFIAYAEVFNLLNIRNTVSYLWIKDVNNNQFAIPNYLTSRQLNIKIIAKIKN